MPEAFRAHSALVRRRACLRDLEQRQLARQRHTVGSDSRRRAHAVYPVRVHLSRDMQTRLGKYAFHFGRDAEVLNDERIDASPPCLTHELDRPLRLFGSTATFTVI